MAATAAGLIGLQRVSLHRTRRSPMPTSRSGAASFNQIVEEQLPRAVEMSADLVSLAGGTNDVLRPKVDMDALAMSFDSAVRQLRESGARVLLFQSVDPTPRSRLIGSTLSRIKALTHIVERTADRYDCYLVRLWDEPVFAPPGGMER